MDERQRLLAKAQLCSSMAMGNAIYGHSTKAAAYASHLLSLMVALRRFERDDITIEFREALEIVEKKIGR
jgi:hypothetical protein